MDNNTKIMGGTILATVLILIGAVFFLSRNTSTQNTNTNTTPIDTATLIRDAGYNTRGPTTAPVTLVEFSDPECPACASFAPTIKAIMDKYPTQIRLIYRHFPLPMHPQAIPGSLAMEAAGLQGKFWEMQDMLFGNQEKLAEDMYPQFAQQLGLNVEKFNQDRASSQIKDILQTDSNAAYNTLNLQATPSLFINGVHQDNNEMTYDLLVKKIDAVLTQTAANPITPESSESSAPATK